MTRADNTTPQKEYGIQIYDPGCGLAGNHAKPVKSNRYHHRHKKFKETFDPQMDDPKTPVVYYGILGGACEKESGQVKERDRYRRKQKK